MGTGEEVIGGAREWGEGVGERGKGVSVALGGKEVSGECVGSKGVDKHPPKNIPASSAALASHFKDNPGGLIFTARMAAYA